MLKAQAGRQPDGASVRYMTLSNHWGAFCFEVKCDPRRSVLCESLDLNIKCDPLELSLILEEKNTLHARTHTGCVCV